MSHLPSEAVQMMREEILRDPQFVLELAQMAGLPTAEDLAAASQALAQMEQAQDAQITALQNQIAQLQTAVQAAQSTANSATNSVANLPDATTTTKGITWFSGDGSETAGRAVQATDGRLKDTRTPKAHQHPVSDVTNLQTLLDGKAGTALATTTTPGLMSAADKTKLDKLGIQQISAGTVSTPAFTLLTAQDATVTLTPAMPDTTYIPFIFVDGTAVGKVSAAFKSKTASTVTVTLTPSALLSLGAGTVTVIAWKVAT